ncbi:hypothetical protein BK128_21610 [Viridibacillus sp. FSL H7-0596]|uniref:dUTP diphosphatase n=1 Tax=Viridibacillus sp. FSL H7-0596 TaxID=1928923 RepID=UPI0009701B1B|nr:dUTP diphosphatase [Viridibacillus sp. FSL H7-0596]OMC81865.1 hypothetical protein BK128_21610 [Viridibacillus sp. FSL H7-0596]
MNLKKLFEAQRELDDYIEQQHPTEPGENRLIKKILALLAEFGELANELPEIFKFWSHKKNNYELALKEFVDVLHFTLSISNDVEANKYSLTKCMSFSGYQDEDWYFGYAYRQTMVFFESVNKGKPDTFLATRMMLAILQLGHKLGFTWEQIEQAYWEKYEINKQRQATGY